MGKREGKVKWELAGIFFILGGVAMVIFFAQRVKMWEEQDRMRLEDVKEIRIALQQHFEEYQEFPEAIPVAVEETEEYQYQCRRDEEGVCADYEITFKLQYSSGQYGKGEYTANRNVIRLLR